MATSFVTIPADYRPPIHKERFTCYNSTQQKPVLVDIETDGRFQLLDFGSSIPVGNVLQLTGTYII